MFCFVSKVFYTNKVLKAIKIIIFKNKDKNITLIKCNTIDGNKDIYIGDYNLNFKSNICK